MENLIIDNQHTTKYQYKIRACWVSFVLSYAKH